MKTTYAEAPASTPKETNAQQLEPVDLTWPFNESTLYWGDTQPFVFIKKTAEYGSDGSWYSSNEFCAGEHGGTHFDAPYHFYKNGWKVGDVPLDRLIAHAVTINLGEETKKLQNNAVLLPQHLEAWKAANGAIPKNSVILINFGWSNYYHDREQYFGIDKEANYHFPGISTAAAKWIAKTDEVVGVGLDTPSVDPPGTNTEFDAHRILAKQQIYVLKNLKIPPKFPARGYVLYVMPMKISEGTGAPLRLVAVSWKTGAIPQCPEALKVPWYGDVVVILSSITLFFLYTSNWII